MRKQSIILLSFVFLIFMAVSSCNAALDQIEKSPVETSLYNNVRRIELDNGLVAFLYPEHRSKAVSVYLAVRAGASDEAQWLGSCLSHFVEHMFFKGTEKRSKGQIEKEVREMGGYINAYTSHDLTVFYLNAMSDHTENAIDLIYDAAFHPTLDPKELEKERQVIISEMRMNEDRLGRQALLALWDLAFLTHPYRHPVIGYPELFKAVSRVSLSNFLKAYYIPNNMVFAVAGDFDPDAVEKMIRDRFEAEPRVNEPPPLAYEITPQITARKKYVLKSAQHARLMIGYPGVVLTHPDAPALDVLSQILGDGNSSRLNQAVKERDDLVLSMNSYHSTLRKSGVFTIETILLHDKVASAKVSILRELEIIKSEGVTEDELQRIINQSIMQFYTGRETYSSIAHDLILGEIYAGDYRYSEKNLEAFKALTREDIQRVANKYLLPNKINEVILWPKDIPLPVDAVVESESRATVDDIEMLRLDNGIRVVLYPDNATPTVNLHFSAIGGILNENDDNSGITAMTADLLTRGTSKRDQKKIAEDVQFWGGGLSAHSGQNT